MCISKPDTAEKLLARIIESPFRDEVISAILKSATSQEPINGQPKNSRSDFGSPGFTAQGGFQGSDDAQIPVLPPEASQTPCACRTLKQESSVVSPLQITAGALANAVSPAHPNPCPDSQAHHVPRVAPNPSDCNANTVDNRLVEYFCMAIYSGAQYEILG
jgi:hypothetical protein